MSITNCEGYLTYYELPEYWCNSLSSWSICGIGDGVIDGKGYGCEFHQGRQGYCYDIDSNSVCAQFVPEQTESPTTDPSEYYSFTNCEGYLIYNELPWDWCNQMSTYSECGIGDGIITGPGRGCNFFGYVSGQCYDIDSGHECTQFYEYAIPSYRPTAIPTKMPTRDPIIWTPSPTMWSWSTSNPTMMGGISNPTEASTSYRPVESHDYCDYYLRYDEVPSDWCEYLSPLSRCGIADGILMGSYYNDCYFMYVEWGWWNCTNIDSNSECTQFLRESSDEPEDIESADSELSENLVIVFIIIPVLCLLVCCILCWKMSRGHKNEWNLEVTEGRQQAIEPGTVADSHGMSVQRHQGVEAAVEMVEPTSEGVLVNSMQLLHLRTAAVGEREGEDWTSTHEYNAPRPTHEPPTPNYASAPPPYEAPPPYCETTF